ARQVIDVSFLNGLNRVCGLVDAFSNAIRGSHDDVTEYLLTLHPRRLFWGMKDACEAAVEMDNKDLVEKICALYRRDYRGESVFVKLAGFGSKNAVEFLYRNRHNDTELINKTFGKAARFGNTAVVEFLLDTGRDIFDKAMECAASSGYGKPATSIFLYNKKLASRKAGIRAFTQANDISVGKLLFENEYIPESRSEPPINSQTDASGVFAS
ncbi:hypothetical protein JG688_00012322, partial [Phytophthora aleatoria]